LPITPPWQRLQSTQGRHGSGNLSTTDLASDHCSSAQELGPPRGSHPGASAPLVASEARAGIAFVKNIGTANSGTATTTSITVPAAGVAAGNSIILTFASADAGTTYSAMDSAGNMYAVDIQGAKAGSVRTVILSAHNVKALASGNTITLTHPSLPGTAKRGSAPTSSRASPRRARSTRVRPVT